MLNFDFKAHDELAQWLASRFGVEGMAMVAKDGPGLDRIRDVFAPFIKALNKCRVITIAGTNGKGETAYRLEKKLLADGLNVATWTSPHLVSVTERIRCNGKEIEANICLELFKRHEKLGENLSYYEFLFLCFLAYSKDQVCDVLLLEVGLGGRLDAVNLFDADLSAVCSIGRDHQAILGNSLEQILYEKLGVTRPSKTCITALDSEFLRAKTKTWTQDKKVKWLDAFEQGYLLPSDTYPRRNQVLSELLYLEFKGQVNSFDLNALKNPSESFPGRREVMTLGKLRFIFIGAHNVDGFRQAVKWWCSSEHPNEIWASFSARAMSDLKTCCALLVSLPQKVQLVFSSFEHPRAIAPNDLRELAMTTQGRVKFEANWKELLSHKDQKQERTIAIVGSYYYVGAVMRELLMRGASRA